VAKYGRKSWTLKKADEQHTEAFEMNGLRRVLRVSWRSRKTNTWVLDKAGVNTALRIGRLRSNRIRIESGVTIRIRIESRIESAVYTA